MTLAATVEGSPQARYNALAFDASRNLFVTMQGNAASGTPANFVWFDTSGIVRESIPATVGGVPTTDYSMALAFGPGGTLYSRMYNDTSLRRVDPLTGGMAFVQSLEGFATDMAFLADGTMCTSFRPSVNVSLAQFSRMSFDAATGTFNNPTYLPLIMDPYSVGYQGLGTLPDGRLIGTSAGRIRIIDLAHVTETDPAGFGAVPTDLRGIVSIPAPASVVMVPLAAPFLFRRRR